MHLDGARSWNASLALGLEMKEMVKDFDIVNVCFSKGMGCPMGSMIAGSNAEIERAKVFRKMLGGAMRQTGIISACALVSLMDWQDKLTIDNHNAKFLAEELAQIPGIRCDPSVVDTNILYLTVEEKKLKQLKTDHRGIHKKILEEFKCNFMVGFYNEYFRFVTHRDVTRADCETVVKAFKTVLA